MSVCTRALVVLSVPLLLSVPACGKDDDQGGAPTADRADPVDQAPQAPGKDPATLFMGDKVTMPPPVAQLELGMTRAQAKAAAPTLADDGTLESPDYPGLAFKADFDPATGKLSRVYVNLPQGPTVERITAQWGPPSLSTEYDEPVLYWFNPEAELRASVGPSFTDEVHVEFTRYWPATKFLGEGPALAFEREAPLLGLTAAELERAYPAYVRKLSADEAAARQEQVRKLAGERAGALLAESTASVALELPPLEWGKYWTPIHFLWSADGEIERLWFNLDYAAHPEAKAELFDLLTAKWGEPEQEDEYGDVIYVFSERPFIKVEEDSISGAWTVHVAAQR